jgi:hypothetical protein
MAAAPAISVPNESHLREAIGSLLSRQQHSCADHHPPPSIKAYRKKVPVQTVTDRGNKC